MRLSTPKIPPPSDIEDEGDCPTVRAPRPDAPPRPKRGRRDCPIRLSGNARRFSSGPRPARASITEPTRATRALDRSPATPSEQVAATPFPQLRNHTPHVVAAIEARDEQRIARVHHREPFDAEQRDQAILTPD